MQVYSCEVQIREAHDCNTNAAKTFSLKDVSQTHGSITKCVKKNPSASDYVVTPPTDTFMARTVFFLFNLNVM